MNMFVGRPPGNYDRLLDFSRAVTGDLFFVPSATFLDGVTAGPARDRRATPQRRPAAAARAGIAVARWLARHRLLKGDLQA